MKNQTLKTFVAASALLGLLSVFPAAAQSNYSGSRRILGRTPALPTSHTKPSGQVPQPGSTSYTFTYFGFPNAQYTGAFSLNLGAATSKIEIMGAYGPEENEDGYGSGMLLEVGGKKGTITEAFTTVNYPGFSLQQTDGINDFGDIVGQYTDSSNHVQGYELSSSGKYSPIQVPFTGASQTLPESINNSGLIVGLWEEPGDGLAHGFTLSGTTYMSFDYPGGFDTQGVGLNNSGEIVGFYYDAANVYHGFLLSGGTYTELDYPGAAGTFAYGINDSGDIVGVYCATSACLTSSSGLQGFLLSDGVYTTINVPNSNWTQLGSINNKGIIVGAYRDSSGTALGFIAIP